MVRHLEVGSAVAPTGHPVLELGIRTVSGEGLPQRRGLVRREIGLEASERPPCLPGATLRHRQVVRLARRPEAEGPLVVLPCVSDLQVGQLRLLRARSRPDPRDPSTIERLDGEPPSRRAAQLS